MRTNIVIDDELMEKAQRVRPDATKRALVEEGLRLVAQMGKQRRLREFRGRLKWEGDLAAMRQDDDCDRLYGSRLESVAQ